MPGVDLPEVRAKLRGGHSHSPSTVATMSTTPDTPPPAAAPATEDRTVAILSYLTIIGFIVALVMHSNKKTALGAFHLRQCLGLIITAIALSVAGVVLAFIPIIGWLAVLVGWLGFLVLWVMGLIAAASGEQKPVPVLGANYQKWFANTFT
jgi:uncharacterized membrane protein